MPARNPAKMAYREPYAPAGGANAGLSRPRQQNTKD
jgi:hypothetical protein